TAKTVTATFDLEFFTVSVATAGSGGGTLTSMHANAPAPFVAASPGELNCCVKSTDAICAAATRCSTSFVKTSNITITAQPNGASNSVVAWSGCPSPSGNTCTVSDLQANTSAITATF